MEGKDRYRSLLQGDKARRDNEANDWVARGLGAETTLSVIQSMRNEMVATRELMYSINEENERRHRELCKVIGDCTDRSFASGMSMVTGGTYSKGANFYGSNSITTAHQLVAVVILHAIESVKRYGVVVPR